MPTLQFWLTLLEVVAAVVVIGSVVFLLVIHAQQRRIRREMLTGETMVTAWYPAANRADAMVYCLGHGGRIYNDLEKIQVDIAELRNGIEWLMLNTVGPSITVAPCRARRMMMPFVTSLIACFAPEAGSRRGTDG